MSYLENKPDHTFPIGPDLEGDNPNAPELEIRVGLSESTVWFAVAKPGDPRVLCDVGIDYWNGRIVLLGWNQSQVNMDPNIQECLYNPEEEEEEGD